MDVIEFLYNSLLYPLDRPKLAKQQRKSYFAYRRKIFKYRIISLGLIGFLLISIKHVL